jgi:hypothetical protein
LTLHPNSYALYERRLQRPEGHTILELIRGKWNEKQQARQVTNGAKASENEGWEELTKEFESAGAGGASAAERS